MQYVKLGKSDLNVSRVCLGCMGFGDDAHGQHSWTLDEEASRTIIRRALETGINFFDTAIVYQNGTSEQYLGRALRDFARREEVVVATKFPVRTREEMDAGISGRSTYGACWTEACKTWAWTMSICISTTCGTIVHRSMKSWKGCIRS